MAACSAVSDCAVLLLLSSSCSFFSASTPRRLTSSVASCAIQLQEEAWISCSAAQARDKAEEAAAERNFCLSAFPRSCSKHTSPAAARSCAISTWRLRFCTNADALRRSSCIVAALGIRSRELLGMSSVKVPASRTFGQECAIGGACAAKCRNRAESDKSSAAQLRSLNAAHASVGASLEVATSSSVGDANKSTTSLSESDPMSAHRLRPPHALAFCELDDAGNELRSDCNGRPVEAEEASSTLQDGLSLQELGPRST
mmetsp:Transcript_66151/g.123448  ORF Transcript_66151/g.123448 Transcript_66151/m.123448 type:complete len:258 (-) Transcript_66151:134-907(-)